MSSHLLTLTIITPAFNEEKNLPILFEKISKVLETQNEVWEWIVIDDHSSDRTPEVLLNLSKTHHNIRIFRLSRNFGSHMALLCGLENALGKCALLMAADLQDPPEVIPDLLLKWRSGSQVVWATRANRIGQKKISLFTSNLYWGTLRRLAGLNSVPPKGADFFLIDRKVIDALSKFQERNLSLYPLLIWMGFRQGEVSYSKQARLHGISGWTLKKKIKLFVDSLIAFSPFPIRLLSFFGFCVALVGFCYALVIIAHFLGGERPQGWASLMVVLLVLGGGQMLMFGVVGEYLWRTLEEGRERPRYLVEYSSEKEFLQKSELKLLQNN